MRQIRVKKIKGIIVVLSGLHIGAGDDKVEIGGMDSPVIRNPLTREPYIPGSSIKGKMRALLEWKENRLNSDGGPCECGLPDCPICRIFGCGNTDKQKARERGPSRLIIRDAALAEDSKETLAKGKPIFEDKTENSLNRVTAQAMPRHIERVVPGVKFDFELIYRIIDTGKGAEDDEKLFESVVLEGLRLLQNDYLGGGGSRGNGRIKFDKLVKFDELTDEKGTLFNL